MMLVIQHAKRSHILDKRRQTRFMRDESIAIADRTRAVISAIGEKLERRFAAFARVPYNDPLELKKWEQLWETEANQSVLCNLVLNHCNDNDGCIKGGAAPGERNEPTRSSRAITHRHHCRSVPTKRASVSE